MLRLVSILVVLAALASPALAQVGERPFVNSAAPGVSLDGKGFAQYATITTAKRLTDTPTAGSAIHGWASTAFLCAETAGVRYRTDGTNPTTSVGTLIPAGSCKTVRRSGAYLREIRFIGVDSTAVLTVEYLW